MYLDNQEGLQSAKKWHRFGLVIIVLLGVCLIIWALIWALNSTKPSPKDHIVNEYQPVIYDVDNFVAAPKSHSANPLALSELSAYLGIGATPDEALDYEGNIAQIYRFAHKNEAPLYVIDSDDFVELGWYFAAAQDGHKDKEASQQHAKKAYLVATHLYGDEGTLFIKNMLNVNSTTANLPNKTVFGACQEYLCRWVIKKS